MAALPLIILFAAYGSMDRTDLVKTLVRDNTLLVAAENSIFTDPWVGWLKTLVVIYQYGNSKPVTAIVQEHQNMTITPNEANQQPWDRPPAIGLNILGAAYGVTDVTAKVQTMIQNDEIHFGDFDNTLGNGWTGHDESLVICYQYGLDTPAGIVQRHDGRADVVGPELKILKAVYGLADVTPTVKSLITKYNNKRLETTVSNTIFQNNWSGISKSLVVLYQYRDFFPQVAIQKDGSSMSIAYQTRSDTYTVPASNSQLQILGAAFGLLDVTEKAKARVQSNTLVVDAWSKVFGDGWTGNKKTLVVFYRYGSKDIQFAVAPDVSTVMDKYPNYVSIRA